MRWVADDLSQDPGLELPEPQGFLHEGRAEAIGVGAIVPNPILQGFQFLKVAVDRFQPAQEMHGPELHTLGVAFKRQVVKTISDAKSAGPNAGGPNPWPSMPFVYMDAQRGGRPFNALRKAWHLLGLAVPLCLYLDVLGPWGPGLTRGVLMWALGLFLLLLVWSDLMRFRNEGFRKVYMGLFGVLLKKDELHRFNASIPYIAANLMLVSFFATEVVVLACLFLNVGDAAASLVGTRFGRVRFWNGRSLAGTLAFVGASVLVGCLFVLWHSARSQAAGPFVLSAGRTPFWVVFAGSAAAATAELLSVTTLRGLVDDNLWVAPAGVGGMAGVLALTGNLSRLLG